MKIKMVLFILFSVLTLSYAGEDSVYVKIDNDSVHIWNTHVYEHCAFGVEFITTILGDSITVTEHDTMLDWTTCSCYFNLCETLTDLAPGSYRVVVYRQYSAEFANPDSLYFIDTTHFEYNVPAQAEVTMNGYQSSCITLPINKVRHTTPDKYIVFRSYPNPFNPMAQIEYSVPFRSAVRLQIYALNGQLIQTLVRAEKNRGRYLIRFDGSGLPSGVYVCRYEIGNLIKRSLKLLLIK